HPSARHPPIKGLPPLSHVLDLDAVLWRPVERGLADVRVRDRNAETRAERAQFLLVHLLLLVRDVLALAGFAKPVSLDGPRENDARGALVFGGGLVSVVHLDWIVSAERQLLQLIVGQVFDHIQQSWIGAPEVLAHVRARFDRVLLILAVYGLAHAL